MSKKVATMHPLYEDNIFTWRQVRDCVEGEAQVKRRNEVYLPMPSAMLDYNMPSPSVSGSSSIISNRDKNVNTTLNPNYHSNEPYKAYKTRAHFPDITGFTLRGLIGIATRKEATVSVPNTFEYLENELKTAFIGILSENLQTGRVPVLVDIKEDKITFNINAAESLINWREDKDGNLILAVFEEEVEDDDIFVTSSSKVNYRVLSIEDGVYTVTVYDVGGAVVEEPSTPTYFNKTLNKIPLIIIGSTNLTPDPDIMPLSSISSVALQLYMKSADLSQAEFLTCNPTLIFTGVSEEDVPKVVGSVVGIALPDPEMKAAYTQTDTAGLDHVMNRMDKLFDQAAAYGSNLLGAGRTTGGVESGEALRLKQTANSATLQSVVSTSSDGIQKCLDIVAEWSGKDKETFEFTAIKELVDLMLNAQEITALVNAWMAGALSHESLVDTLRRTGLFIDNRTTEEELKAIIQSMPISTDADAANDEEDEDENDEGNDEENAGTA